jgi:hypothetical protein
MSSVFSINLPEVNVIYLDTEFTDLLEPELLSLAMVTSAGDEHYVELDLHTPEGERALSASSDFVADGGVAEQWGRVPGATSSHAGMASRTVEWLQEKVRSFGQPATIAFDHEIDFRLFKELVDLAPGGKEVLRQVVPVNVSDITTRFDGALGADAVYAQLRRRGLARHHALVDAHALRGACLSMQTGKRVQL